MSDTQKTATHKTMANREIKFRCWLPKLKKLTQPFELSEIPSLFTDGIQADWIFMQFTGLKDKNGKEIYEGDIMKVPNRKRLAKKEPTYITKVVWRLSGLTLDKNDTYFTDFAVISAVSKHSEVIGNIYEHPNFLPNGN